MTGIRDVRLAAGLSQVAAAAAWRRSQSQVARIESMSLERIKVGTLHGFVSAVGGSVRITVQVNGRTFDLPIDIADTD